MIGAKVITLVFRYAYFVSRIWRQNSSPGPLAVTYLDRQPGWNFSYEAKAKFVWVTRLNWRDPEKYTACNENDTYKTVKSEIIYYKD